MKTHDEIIRSLNMKKIKSKFIDPALLITYTVSAVGDLGFIYKSYKQRSDSDAKHLWVYKVILGIASFAGSVYLAKDKLDTLLLPTEDENDKGLE